MRSQDTAPRLQPARQLQSRGRRYADARTNAHADTRADARADAGASLLYERLGCVDGLRAHHVIPLLLHAAHDSRFDEGHAAAGPGAHEAPAVLAGSDEPCAVQEGSLQLCHRGAPTDATAHACPGRVPAARLVAVVRVFSLVRRAGQAHAQLVEGTAWSAVQPHLGRIELPCASRSLRRGHSVPDRAVQPGALSNARALSRAHAATHARAHAGVG